MNGLAFGEDHDVAGEGAGVGARGEVCLGDGGAEAVGECGFAGHTAGGQEIADRSVAAAAGQAALDGEAASGAVLAGQSPGVLAQEGPGHIHGRGLDVLFANAGGGGMGPLGHITPGQFDETFGINVRGTLFTVQKALPLLHSGASVILSGSTAGSNGKLPAFSVYAASKAAIRSFARTWAAELAGRGIRVNAITPGPTETPGLLAGAATLGDQAPALLQSIAASVPLGRLATSDEIANAVLFLASHQSSFVTGTEFFADGGQNQI